MLVPRLHSLKPLTAIRTKYTLPDLPYAYNALEPVISEEIMRLHHQKHHQAYVTNLNAAMTAYTEAHGRNDLTAQVAACNSLKFNGGGHINHSIFWQNLCSQHTALGSPKDPNLRKAITDGFDSVENFMNVFNSNTTAIQGSGWGWLGFNLTTGQVQFAITHNQDPLTATTGLIPLLGVDVWEHAYYPQYKNARVDYLKAIWSIINWEDVAHRFARATSQK